MLRSVDRVSIDHPSVWRLDHFLRRIASPNHQVNPRAWLLNQTHWPAAHQSTAAFMFNPVCAVKWTTRSGSQPSFCNGVSGRQKYWPHFISPSTRSFIHLTSCRRRGLPGPPTLFRCQSPWNWASNEIHPKRVPNWRPITPTPSQWLTARRPPRIPHGPHRETLADRHGPEERTSHIWSTETSAAQLPLPSSTSSSSPSSALSSQSSLWWTT